MGIHGFEMKTVTDACVLTPGLFDKLYKVTFRSVLMYGHF